MKKNVLKIVFTLALVVAVCVGTAMSISAHEHRFNFRTIIFPDDTFTQTLGINDFDTIAGYHGAAVNKGFVFAFPNNFTSENFPNSAQTQVIGINNRGYTDGFYIDAAGTNHGFLDINGSFRRPSHRNQRQRVDLRFLHRWRREESWFSNLQGRIQDTRFPGINTHTGIRLEQSR